MSYELLILNAYPGRLWGAGNDSSDR